MFATINMADLKARVIDLLDSDDYVLSTFTRLRDALDLVGDDGTMIGVVDLTVSTALSVLEQFADAAEILLFFTSDSPTNELGEGGIEKVFETFSSSTSRIDMVLNDLVTTIEDAAAVLSDKQDDSGDSGDSGDSLLTFLKKDD